MVPISTRMRKTRASRWRAIVRSRRNVGRERDGLLAGVRGVVRVVSDGLGVVVVVGGIAPGS